MSYYFELPHLVVITVSGKDAPRYLQARLTNDIRLVKAGSAVPAAALSPQGKTEAVFTVLSGISPTDFLLYGLTHDPQASLAALRRFIVADRVTTELRADLTLLHVTDYHAVPGVEGNLYRVAPFGGGHAVTLRRSETTGVDLLVPRTEQISLVSQLGLPMITSEESEIRRFSAGLPRFPEELNDRRLFLEGELDDHISSNKGCYAGQEVVEKVISFAKVPRVIRFGLIPSGDMVHPATKVTDTQGETAGEILAAYQTPAGWVASLSLRTEALGQPLTVLQRPLTLIERAPSTPSPTTPTLPLT